MILGSCLTYYIRKKCLCKGVFRLVQHALRLVESDILNTQITEQCEERLQELESGEIEVSFRNRVPLDCYTLEERENAKTEI